MQQKFPRVLPLFTQNIHCVPPVPRPNVLQMRTATRSTGDASQRFWYILSINTHKGIPSFPIISSRCLAPACAPHLVTILSGNLRPMLYYVPSFYFYERWLCPHAAPSFNFFVSGLRAGVHSAVGLFHLKSYAPCTLAREYVSQAHVGWYILSAFIRLLGHPSWSALSACLFWSRGPCFQK